MGHVYLLTSPSGKSYVGITRGTAERRFVRHIYAAHSGAPNALHRALRKHDPKDWNVRTLLVCENAELFRYEQALISHLKTFTPHGYNLTAGGEMPFHTEETRRKQSLVSKRVWTGRKHTPEAKQRMSEAANRRWAKGVPVEHRETGRKNANKRWGNI